MSISLRILLGYFAIVGLAAVFVMSVFVQEIKPGGRRILEDSLVDTANLLAELAAPELEQGGLDSGRFAAAVAAYGRRSIDADIWEHHKSALDLQVYVTDARGIVVFDSTGRDLGADYSRWNDVLRTLQGRYGARSTPASPQRPDDTRMHVAAPVLDRGGRIIGSLTVVRSNRSLAPIVARSERRIRLAGYLLIALSLALGALFTWRLTRAIHRLRDYARALSEGRRVERPHTSSRELAELGQAVETMRDRVDGRDYVEKYVQTLTHELKSPVAAVRGAAELLQERMEARQRRRFTDNILDQCGRIERVTGKMLDLAAVEQRKHLESAARLDLAALVAGCVEAAAARLAQCGLRCETRLDGRFELSGDAFLLARAVDNLLDNAIDFSPRDGLIRLALVAEQGWATLTLADQGPGIPAYAEARLFERFYSLPRPDGSRRGTGLGLPFVAEVAKLHGGTVSLGNGAEGGAVASLRLPLA